MVQIDQTIARDETLRDGNQGEAPRSTFRGVEHLIGMSPFFEMMSIGWIYTNPADIEVARYLRAHGAEMAAKSEHFNTDKLFAYTLVHLKDHQTPEDVIRDGRNAVVQREHDKGNDHLTDAEIVSKLDPFPKMLLDLQSKLEPGKSAPYGAVNILAKARVSDLKDFGPEVTPESFKQNILNTIRLIRKANPDIQVELALEHFYTAWLESENQQANRKHMIDTLAAAISEGVVRITAPDTDGAHTPEDVTKVIREVTAALRERIREFSPSMIIAHMHDDLGHAAANTKAAIEAGAGAFDTTVGTMGERRGNGTFNDIVETMHGSSKFARYQTELQKVLGMSADDKPIGSAQAFCGTGGMHADHAFKELCKLIDKERKAKKEEEPENEFVTRCYNKFVSTYNGSYASVPPSRFGQKLQMTLSPVAGAANVLFMLAGLGMNLRDKKDPRIAEVLQEIKNGEHERALNYRGYNNTNAFLLLAEKFGLRDGNKRQLTVGVSSQPHDSNSAMLDLHIKHNNKDVNETLYWPLSIAANSEADATLKHGQEHDPHQDGATALKIVARDLLQQSKKALVKLDKDFGQIDLKDLRVLEGAVGTIRPENGNVLRPQPERIRSVVKLIFTMGGTESFQANGSGNTYEEAIGMALHTALNYKSFQIEREQGKASCPPRS